MLPIVDNFEKLLGFILSPATEKSYPPPVSEMGQAAG
jgi:hypothetical protein